MEIRAYGDVKMYAIVTEKDDTLGLESCWIARHPDLPGCMSDGRTEWEAIDNLNDARAEYLQSMRDDGLTPPEPNSDLTVTR